MKWLDTLEQRFHWFTIPQFPLFIATANGLIYLMAQFQPIFVNKLVLDPEALRLGEWWRAFTFLFVPPLNMNPIFLVFWLLVLYQIAQALETAWGEFRFFFFYLIGAVATDIAAVAILHEPLGNGSLNITLFLAFATLFPNQEFFIFPLPLAIKVKYLAWIGWIMISASFILGSYSKRIAIAASLANYFFFFGPDLWRAGILKWEVYQNRRRFRS